MTKKVKKEKVFKYSVEVKPRQRRKHMEGRKDVKQQILELLQSLLGETSSRAIQGYSDQIKKLIGELPKTTYKARGKLNCHAALDFLKAAEESFAALAGDLDATRGKLDSNDSRQEVLLLLAARAERFVGEMQEAYQTINRINRF